MKLPAKAEPFINIPGRFFHYEPLLTSSFSKNLIIPEAEKARGSEVSFYFTLIPDPWHL